MPGTSLSELAAATLEYEPQTGIAELDRRYRGMQERRLEDERRLQEELAVLRGNNDPYFYLSETTATPTTPITNLNTGPMGSITPVSNDTSISSKLDLILTKLDRVSVLEEAAVLMKQYKDLVKENYMFKTRREERELLTKIFQLLDKT